MTFSQHDSIQPNAVFELPDTAVFIERRPARSSEAFHLFRQKITPPESLNMIERPRVMQILEQSQRQFPATLVLGRAGTGKTWIAANLATNRETAWYSIESTDSDWPVFAKYFIAAVLGEDAIEDANVDSGNGTQTEIARFLVRIFSRFEEKNGVEPTLIVLDNVHSVFDAPWFNDFFDLLLYSLPSSAHLLLLSRSKPPKPLWRLRSKQLLNVLDEKTIAFDLDETEALLRSRGKAVRNAKRAHGTSFGRVSKLLELCRR